MKTEFGKYPFIILILRLVDDERRDLRRLRQNQMEVLSDDQLVPVAVFCVAHPDKGLLVRQSDLVLALVDGRLDHRDLRHERRQTGRALRSDREGVSDRLRG